ncbi:MAG: iron ABC transporter permease [Azoarcus sp.]|jgi:iron complex transport system permease protein|nr:iron ABC transporter permease [Azoarcus sp.]
MNNVSATTLRRLVPFALTLGLLAAIVASLCIGAYPMSFWRAADIVGHLALPWALPEDLPWPAKEVAVVQVLRLPRVLLAVFVGIALGISGTALQGMMRNPLVGPDLVGVSSGAACGYVLGVLFDCPPGVCVAVAFFGGMTAMGCAYGLAKLARGAEGIGLIIAGIFIGAFCMACVGLAQFLANDGQLQNMVFWLMGSLTRAKPNTVWTLAAPTLVCGSVLMAMRWRLNLLSLGDVDAASLGVPTRLLRFAVVALVSWMVAAQVSVSGIVGWVGLVIPHVARMLVGPDHRRLLPASALLGGLFVLLVDDFTRVALRAEVPIGVLTSLIGTPFLVYLFWKKKTKGWNDG